MGSLEDVPKKNWLEQVQRRAVCFATKTHSRQEGCVTQALSYLNWPTLEHRRKANRLTLMYKTLHGQAAINIPPYVKHKIVTKTRNSDPVKFIRYKHHVMSINTLSGLEHLMTGTVYSQTNFTSISNFKGAVNNYISA